MTHSLVRAIYTDGSGNLGLCGYAAVVRFADSTTIELGGSESDSTNLRAELLGVITALEYLQTNPQPLEAPIFSDSKYAIDGLNEHRVSIWQQRSWLTPKGNPVANRDLWERLEALRSVPATFHHLRGHSDAAGKKGRVALAKNRACFGEETHLHNAGNQAADHAADGFRLNWAALKPGEQTDIKAKAVSYVRNFLPD